MKTHCNFNPPPASLPRGEVIQRCHREDPKLSYFLYLPQGDLKKSRILVAVHGISRNAYEQAFSFASQAEGYGVILVAPSFDKDSFTGYQRLGWTKKSTRADLALERILDEVIQLTGAPEAPCSLFGFSGGGQFAHRYAMAYPERVARVVLGAPGWYTFPDPTRRYPWGIKSSRHSRLGFTPSQFLSIPTCVLVGEYDNLRDEDLNKSSRIDSQQGCDRLERGSRWVQAMVAAARARNLDAHFCFEVLPGVDHSFSNCIKFGSLEAKVFNFLFGAPSRSTAAESRLLSGFTQAKVATRQKTGLIIKHG